MLLAEDGGLEDARGYTNHKKIVQYFYESCFYRFFLYLTYIPQTKALTESQAIQGSIEEKSKDRPALADVEDVVNENSILEDEQVVQSAFVSSPVDKDRPQSESDEDVEVDIDGSDNDEVNPCLIPGK